MGPRQVRKLVRHKNCEGDLQRPKESGGYWRTSERLQLVTSVNSCACTVLGAHVQERVRASSPAPNFKPLESRDRAACLGGLAGIFGLAIHSFVDFGLHITINALVFLALTVWPCRTICFLAQKEAMARE